MKKTIMIVDDEIMFAEGLKALFLSNGNYTVIGTASNGLECLGRLDRSKPDILIMNPQCGELSGLDVLKIIKEHNMPIKVIFVSSFSDISLIINALNNNVDGYLLKTCQFNQLLVAVESTLNNNQFIQAGLLDKINSYLAKNDKIDEVKLTSRETQILKMLASGLLNKEIGSELNISERTVKNHVSNIFKKIGVSDRTQAAVYAIKNNLVEL